MTVKRGCTEPQLERMMDQYGSAMLRLCYVYLKNRSAAEDAVQEAFIKTYQKCPQFESAAQEKAWIMQVTANICKDILRSGWNRHIVLTEEYPEPVAPEKTPETDSDLLQAVLALKPNYRMVIVMHYYLDFRVNEIAKILKVPQSTISVRLRRARNLLKQKIIDARCT